ncbi:MAG: hypothetical protein EAZ27_02135 [Cytophagales bacterium]|nr:MAG: hypothetical protein EAZ27_02135 [Cytophagales bacterium]
MSLEENEKKRFLFLKYLYTQSSGDATYIFIISEVGKELDYDEVKLITSYLFEEKLVKFPALGGVISITHQGIKEVENTIRNPIKNTEQILHYNTINIGTMNNSSLQQSTTNSGISFVYNEQKSLELNDIIKLLKDIKDSFELSNDLQNELITELQTIELQSKSVKPKNIIIYESLKTIRTILESVASNAIAPLIIDRITALLCS